MTGPSVFVAGRASCHAEAAVPLAARSISLRLWVYCGSEIPRKLGMTDWLYSWQVARLVMQRSLRRSISLRLWVYRGREIPRKLGMTGPSVFVAGRASCHAEAAVPLAARSISLRLWVYRGREIPRYHATQACVASSTPQNDKTTPPCTGLNELISKPQSLLRSCYVRSLGCC
jgi:hypothetical protein